MSHLRLLLAFLLLPAALLAGEASPAQKELQAILTRQQLLFAKASADEGKGTDPEEFKSQVQNLVFDYEAYIKKYPETAAGYAAYGAMLDRIDMRRNATIMLLKANKLDPNQAFVKNQLGNHLAEDGKPLEAVNYFLAAIKLDPDEPLYHYQLGTLLTEARDDFLKSGEWPRAALDKAMLAAFKRAAELAPTRIEFTYRYGEAFYDLEKPNWDEALKVWGDLEIKLSAGLERETVLLHRANILIKQNEIAAAKILLGSVTNPTLKSQKEKLIAQLPENTKK